MNNQPHSSSHALFGFHPVVLGTACCVLSALCYSAANICLRQLAELKADEMWVTCMKEVVTVSVVGPWLLVQAVRGRKVWPSRRMLAGLMLTGLVVQLAGNLAVQWALGVVGMAVTIPVVFGVLLTTSALLGLTFLGETVSRPTVGAIGLLVVAIGLLSFGAASSMSPEAGSSAGSTRILLSVAAACLAGAVFALLSTVIRFAATAHVPVSTIVFVITGMGVLSMGGLSAGRLGVDTLLHTDRVQLAWMLAAGTCNLVAFLAITKGLQLTSVVHANLLNASQVAMGALAGILIFHESLTSWLLAGVLLTIAGMVLVRAPSETSEV